MSLSEYWKVKQSSIRPIEMKDALESLRRLVSSQIEIPFELNFGKSDATWVMSHGHDKLKIQVSPIPIMESETYPIPPEIFDVECGLVLHEIGHHLADSDATRGRMSSQAQQKTYNLLNQVGEEFIADNYFGNSAKQSKYIRSTRKYYSKKWEESGKSAQTGEALTDACNAYMQMLIYNNPKVDISPEGQKILLKILEHFSKLDPKSATQRRDVYTAATTEIYEILRNQAQEEIIKQPKKTRSGSSGSGSSSYSRSKQDREERQLQNKVEQKLSKAEAELEEETEEDFHTEEMEELQEELAEAIEKDSEDVTQLLAQIVENLHNAPEEPSPQSGSPISMPQERAEALVGSTVVENAIEEEFYAPDERLSASLVWLNNIKEERLRINKHNLESGKVDKRRLHKLVSKLSANVFRTMKSEKKQTRKIWLVLDGSGSMAQHEEFFTACASFQKVLKDARVYQYALSGTKRNPSASTVMIHRIDCKDQIRYHRPQGDTPSGSALVYVVDLMKKLEGSGIVIHLSDGDQNCGISRNTAEEVLQKYSTIKVYHLLYRTSGWKNAENVDSVEEFGNALKKIYLESQGMKI